MVHQVKLDTVTNRVLDHLGTNENVEERNWRIWVFTESKELNRRYIRVLSAVQNNSIRFDEEIKKLDQEITMILEHLLTSDETTTFGHGQGFNNWQSLILNNTPRFENMAVFFIVRALARHPHISDEDFVKTVNLFSRNVFNFDIEAHFLAPALERFPSLIRENIELFGTSIIIGSDFKENFNARQNKKISCNRFWKKIIDTSLEVVPGILGGISGDSIGKNIAPVIGRIAGIVTGYIGSSLVTGSLGRRCTQWIFNLPEDEKLENAYRFLGLPCSASNDDINLRFVEQAGKYPEKNNQNEEWTQLQSYMDCIKKSKSEFYRKT